MCTEVAERSPDSSTDQKLMLFESSTSHGEPHIDEKLSARRVRWIDPHMHAMHALCARSTLLGPSALRSSVILPVGRDVGERDVCVREQKRVRFGRL